MRLLKRILLFLSVGTVSIVLAGCYGIRSIRYDRSQPPFDETPETGAPVSELETAPASSTDGLPRRERG